MLNLDVNHRDIKPANILMFEQQNIIKIKLADFGVSRTADILKTLETATIIGTNHYASPLL